MSSDGGGYANFSGRLFAPDYAKFMQNSCKMRCLICQARATGCHSIGKNTWFHKIENYQKKVLYLDPKNINDCDQEYFEKYHHFLKIPTHDASVFYGFCNSCDAVFYPIDRILNVGEIRAREVALMGMRAAACEFCRIVFHLKTSLFKSLGMERKFNHFTYLLGILRCYNFYWLNVKSGIFDYMYWMIIPMESNYLLWSDITQPLLNGTKIFLANTIIPHSDGKFSLVVSFHKDHTSLLQEYGSIGLNDIFRSHNWFIDIEWWDKQAAHIKNQITLSALGDREIHMVKDNQHLISRGIRYGDYAVNNAILL